MGFSARCGAGRGAKDGLDAHVARLWLQLGTLRPFWGDSPLPFTKGAAYLRKIEAHTPRDLSITQLKAIKLLIWVAILHGLE